jgi:hypothetical protein
MMKRIVAVHFPDLDRNLLESCLAAFYRLRDVEGVEKKPATRELLNWLRAMLADPDIDASSLDRGALPYLGILFKKSADLRAAQTLVSA